MLLPTHNERVGIRRRTPETGHDPQSSRRGRLALVPAHSLEASQRIERHKRAPAFDVPLEIHVASVVKQFCGVNSLAVPVQEIVAVKYQVATFCAEFPVPLPLVEPYYRTILLQRHLQGESRNHVAIEAAAYNTDYERL